MIIISVGWTNIIQNMKLCIYHLSYVENGPEVLFSVAIQENFAWIVLYRKQIVNPEYCSLLRNMPSEMNSGTQLFNLGIMQWLWFFFSF